MAIHMDCDGLTDVGHVRQSNQDQFLIADLRKSLEVFRTSLNVQDHTRLFGGSQGKLLMVADGMGGHAGGERASTLAVDTLAMYILNSLRWCFRLEQDSDDDFVDELKAALEECQQSVVAESEAFPKRRGMGTTLTMAYIVWPRAYVVHAGDSRCYLYRRSELRQVTRDHTMAQELVDAGVLSARDVEASPWQHKLWNAIGGGDEVHPEVYRADLSVGDTLLLCTDGLTKELSDEEIAQVLDNHPTAEQICGELVDEANHRGGSDNITAVVARFAEGGPGLATAEACAAQDESGASDPLAETDDFVPPQAIRPAKAAD